jgi:hypothetical protein
MFSLLRLLYTAIFLTFIQKKYQSHILQSHTQISVFKANKQLIRIILKFIQKKNYSK